jgi:hypothetical protein
VVSLFGRVDVVELQNPRIALPTVRTTLPGQVLKARNARAIAEIALVHLVLGEPFLRRISLSAFLSISREGGISCGRRDRS